MDIYLDPTAPEPLREAVKSSIEADCQGLYRQKKTRFKDKWFTKRGGLDHAAELEDAPPTGMPIEDWRRLLATYTREDRVARAERNRHNRSLQPYMGTHGRKSIAAHRAEYAVSYICLYCSTYIFNNGIYMFNFLAV